MRAIDGGRGRTRTDTKLPSADFESAVAANFTTRPSSILYRSTMSRCALSIASIAQPASEGRKTVGNGCREKPSGFLPAAMSAQKEEAAASRPHGYWS